MTATTRTLLAASHIDSKITRATYVADGLSSQIDLRLDKATRRENASVTRKDGRRCVVEEANHQRHQGE